MSFVGSNNSIGTLFSSLGSNSAGFGTSSLLADYASIQSGGYYKLLKAYYGADKNASSRVSEAAQKQKESMSISKDGTKKLAKIEHVAESLKKSADALLTKGSKSVFGKIMENQEDGTAAAEYGLW